MVYKLLSDVLQLNIKKMYLEKTPPPPRSNRIHFQYIGKLKISIDDSMHYSEKEDTPALLLLIDFQKAVVTYHKILYKRL